MNGDAGLCALPTLCQGSARFRQPRTSVYVRLVVRLPCLRIVARPSAKLVFQVRTRIHRDCGCVQYLRYCLHHSAGIRLRVRLMIRDYRAVQVIAKAIAVEAKATMDAYRRSRITDEPHITDRLLGAIESRIRHLRFGPVASSAGGRGLRLPILWEAMTLRSGPHSAAHEQRYGADILGVFSAQLPDYNISKGFLAQAKRAEPGVDFPRNEWVRLIQQCERMLTCSPDSFVIVYSKKLDVRFFSALAVTSLKGRDLFDLYSMATSAFFTRHFQSFIGDRRLDNPVIEVLDRLQVDEPADTRPSRHVLSITARLAK